MALYLNGQSVKIAMVKYNHNDYEKVLAGDENVTVTVPSSATPITNALKGCKKTTVNYSGSDTGNPWGATTT